MLFVIQGLDCPNAAALRKEVEKAHLDHIDRHASHIVMAGPLLDQQRETDIGSLLIVDFPSRRTAQEFAHNDPFALAGLFNSLTILDWEKSRPKPKA